MINLFRKNSAATKPIQEAAPAPAAPAKSRPARQQAFAEQTIDYLKTAEPDDVLELMLPRLVIEQQTRLASTARELEEIDQKLAKLYVSREDVYSVMAQNQANGVADF